MRTPGVLAALAVALALPLAGCTQLLSVNEQALVVGAALDRGPTAGSVTVTLQWFHAMSTTEGQQGGGGGGTGGGAGSGGTPLVVRSGTGPDVAAAVQAVQDQAERRVSLAILNAVLLGRGLAAEGAAAPLDFFFRSPEVSELAQVGVVDGSAEDLLAHPPEGSSAFDLARRLEIARASPLGALPIPLWEFLALAATPYRAGWAPLLREGPGGSWQVVGTALFRAGRLVGTLDPEETTTLGWLLGRGGYGDLLLPRLRRDGEAVSLRVRGRRLALSCWSPRAASLSLQLTAEPADGPGLEVASGVPPALAAAATAQATQDVHQLLQALQADDADVLGFGERLRERDPQAAAGWPEAFRRLRVAVQVSVAIRPAGLLA